MNQEICTGNGTCMYCDLDYCKPIHCPNFKLCGEILPLCIAYCHEGTCGGCAVQWGKLAFSEEPLECPICLDTKPSVKQLKCLHTVCLDCFKRCHKSPDEYEPQNPPFPYPPDIEEEYYNAIEDSDYDETTDIRWKNDPLIKKYHEDCEKNEFERERRYDLQASLRSCPICRKSSTKY